MPSAWPHGNPYTRAGSVRIMTGLMDELGIDRAVVVGSSAGGTVALEVGDDIWVGSYTGDRIAIIPAP